MTIHERMDRLEKSLGKHDPLVIELRDAVTVTASLQAQEAGIVKSHALQIEESRRLREQDAAEHRQRMAEHRESMRLLDQRIADLVSGFGEFIRRYPPPQQ